eukprot:TRINITY_DN16789_c4_g1_i1.p1 TRINITY_DN16789_c4_g1~~TRINITY_DN16789_c4_g1_i1.p1  ORF type:complete len:576 (+),score=86.16 TRINITY_DN16789_c4_g1_i1:62-1789(+)
MGDPSVCPVTGMPFATSSQYPSYANYLQATAADNSGVYFISDVDKVSSRDSRQARLIILSYKRLIMVNKKNGDVKRYTHLVHVTKLVRKPSVAKGKEVDQVLVVIPNEVDMLLEFQAGRMNSHNMSLADKFCTTMDKIRTSQAQGTVAGDTIRMVNKQKWLGIETAAPAGNLYRSARLQRSQTKGYQSPQERLHAHNKSPTRSKSPIRSPDLGPPTLEQLTVRSSPPYVAGGAPSPMTAEQGDQAVPKTTPNFPLAAAAEQNLVKNAGSPVLAPSMRSSASQYVESPRLGRVKADGTVELEEEVHDLEYVQGLPSGYTTDRMVCVRKCGTKDLHLLDEGYVKCRSCPNVLCCKSCFSKMDTGVEERQPSQVSVASPLSFPASPAAPSPREDDNSIRRGGRVPSAVADISPTYVREAPAASSPDWEEQMSSLPRADAGLFPEWNGNDSSLPPTPPETWCYYEQVNPDPVARKHTYYVYKKRLIYLEEDVDGLWFVVASKRQVKDGNPEKIHMSHVTKVGEEAPQSATLNSFKIGFFVRTSNTKYVFLTPTTIERGFWLQWFSNTFPGTRVEQHSLR